jgi:hypothetical protein
MSKELKRHGFTFVGTTICYAFMQAVGMVNDHTAECFRWQEVQAYPSHRERTSPSLQTAGSAILVRSVLKEYQGIQRKKYRILPMPA